jgi:cytidine deaminase
MPDYSQLIAAAMEARQQSIAPFSKFQVGAALLTADGKIIRGANVESASYSLSCCAERVVLFKALTDGHQNFTALAVASVGGAAPCGACRQLIAEYAPNAEIIIIDSNRPGTAITKRINQLLPDSFTGKDLPSA